MLNKIYIIGGLRSGKSFMGGKLSEKIGIPHFNLDEIVWVRLGQILRDEESRNEELKKILKHDKWIIEGTYTEEWILPALVEADSIIWLNTPKIIKIFRFIKQIIKSRETERHILGRAMLILGFKHKKLDRSWLAYKTLLRPFMDKVIILKSKADINSYLQKILDKIGTLDAGLPTN